MSVRAFAPADLDAVHRLLCAHGWAARVGPPRVLAGLIAASQRVFVADAEGEVVGFVRALTDGCSNGYLSMLVVAPAWRRRGIGCALVEAATAGDARVPWVLRAGRDGAAAFFSRLGFEPSAVAMERRRTA